MKRYAIFFPQFNQIKVNDQAWGYGFTDWSLVSVANAFDYWKRRSPVSGFYDLADERVVAQQFSSAAQAGVEGFGIYHYWFEDGSELGAVEHYLEHAQLPANFDYFYIWANESWSKRWAGKDTEILKTASTTPSVEKIREHVGYLKPFMKSASYTHVSGRPLFVIYRPEFFKDAETTVACYRQEFEKAGLNPLIGYCLKSMADAEYSKFFDFCYLFEPRLFFNFGGVRKIKLVHLIYKKIMHAVPYARAERWSALVGKLLNRVSKTYSFQSFLDYFVSSERNDLIEKLDCPVQNILTCGWNNAPRYRQYFTELEVPNDSQFSQMLANSLSNPMCANELPLLCNAWNEWSEGAAIEPCHYLGDAMLKSYMSDRTESQREESNGTLMNNQRSR
jgi:hypothetical protein